MYMCVYMCVSVYVYIYVCMYMCVCIYMGFPGGSVVKNPPTNAGDVRDVGSIPGSGRSPEVGHGNPRSSILACKIPSTEEPGRP